MQLQQVSKGAQLSVQFFAMFPHIHLDRSAQRIKTIEDLKQKRKNLIRLEKIELGWSLQNVEVMCYFIYLCLPPSEMGEVCCFPCRQLILHFDWRIIYIGNSKGLWEDIPKSILSVCQYHVFQTYSWPLFYSKSLMSYINGFISTSFTNQWNDFFKFQIPFWIIGWKSKIFKWISKRENWSKCNVLYINGFISPSSTN